MSSSKPHYLGVKALIQRDDKLLVSDVLRRDVNGVPARGSYVILWPAGPETIDDGRLAKDQAIDSDCEFAFDGQAVAVDALGALDVLDRVITQVIGQRVVVEGRSCDPIRVTAEAVSADSEIRPPLFYVPFELSFWSRRT